MFDRPGLNRSRALPALLACLVLSAPPDFAAADPAAVTLVEITKFAFEPREITVTPGSRVRWINHDETPHTVTSAPGQDKTLASKALDTDDQYETTFVKQGDFAYYCTVHPFMTGVVHVRKS